MGRLLDTVKAKLAAIRQELALPMPDAGIDPNAAVDEAPQIEAPQIEAVFYKAIRQFDADFCFVKAQIGNL